LFFLKGIEDFMGDIDFKIAGTREGITAVQADVKMNGLTPAIAREVIEKSQGKL
jgi:polyribonucleotide nucleotidyltransferase